MSARVLYSASDFYIQLELVMVSFKGVGGLYMTLAMVAMEIKHLLPKLSSEASMDFMTLRSFVAFLRSSAITSHNVLENWKGDWSLEMCRMCHANIVAWTSCTLWFLDMAIIFRQCKFSYELIHMEALLALGIDIITENGSYNLALNVQTTCRIIQAAGMPWSKFLTLLRCMYALYQEPSFKMVGN